MDILKNKINKIKMIALDVDGTLTDGKIYTDDNQNNLKAFDVKDGFIIVKWIEYGGKVAIITGKTSNIVKRRGEELKINYIRQGIKNKIATLNEILEKENIGLENVCYIGDDINDMGIMSKVGLSGAPADASLEVRELANVVSANNGGKGAVREIIELIMKSNGMWEKVVKEYLDEE
jgi:3-deoxy-D-manno-octulosonate 8-phosphate phosphatase (KDO 8-P phosphatase)